MTTIENVSRREFLRGVVCSGALVLGTCLGPEVASALPESEGAADRAVFRPNVFVGIDVDGTVHIVAHRSEMGNGSRTALPRILADELDADWSRVRIVQAVGDARYGAQDTDASQSVRMFFRPMREMGAAGRLMLLRAAALGWSVPVSECATGLHEVVHVPTRRTQGYGELALTASRLPVPSRDELQLKPRSAWRYIGRDAKLYDLGEICRGKAVYGMDVRVDGMVYASIERPPVLGGTIKTYSDEEALRVRGVQRTVVIPGFKAPHALQPLGGVAVIADNTWAAFEGRKRLKVVWEPGANAVYRSSEYKAALQKTAREPGKVVRDVGDVDAEFAKGGKVIEAEYFVPHLAHAPMEPPVAVAAYKDGKVTIWAPVQNPQGVQEIVASTVGIHKEDVTCHVTLLGGGFGRKSFSDFVAEAAFLSKQLGRPVKVVWTREDDIGFDYYLPVAAVYMKAAVDSAGRPTAWLQRSAFPPINSTFNTAARNASWELNGNWVEAPFDVPNIRVENGAAQAHVRVGWLRSVTSVYHTFAMQSFIAELAHHAGRDPLEYLLEVFGAARVLTTPIPNYPSEPDFPLDMGRLLGVTKLAAEKAGWGKRKLAKGSGLGIAAHRYAYTYVASVVEVHVSETGEVQIPRVDTAVDAGTIVNPANVKAQLEGAAVFGTSIARTGLITATDGVVDQSNFHDYRVARMVEAPRQTNVHLVASTAPPSGLGEAGVSVIPPAIYNAIFAATGQRVRELPLALNRLGS